MLYRLLLIVPLIAVMLCASCPGSGTKQVPTQAKPKLEAQADTKHDPTEPVPFNDRPYKDVHQSVKDAWFLVETAYYVIATQWQEAEKLTKSSDPAKVGQGQQLKKVLSADIERNIFGVNPKVDALFKQALEAEPDNPLNMASYGFYLRSRKRYEAPTSDNYKNAEKEALDMFDKAAQQWPDEWSFYMLKAFALNEPLFCDTWFRATAMEELVIADRLPLIREACTKAEQQYSENAYINYYKALVISKFTDDESFSTVKDEILREIKAGNAKRDTFFYFAPPLRPIMDYGIKPTVSAEAKEAQYIDHWRQLGHNDPNSVALLVTRLTKDMSWPKDKADMQEVMFFLYRLGRTFPQDRSFFALQVEVMNPVIEKLEPGSKDALLFRQLMSFLTAQYKSTAEQLYPRYVKDRMHFDVQGIAIAETQNSRESTVYQECQAREAAYLKKAGEMLGMQFNLPEDPAQW